VNSRDVHEPTKSRILTSLTLLSPLSLHRPIKLLLVTMSNSARRSLPRRWWSSCRLVAAAAACLLLLACATGVLATAPQNHKPVPHNGQCMLPTLSPDDFCYSTVTYPIASTLLKANSHLISPRHKKSHKKIIHENRIEVLSKKAHTEFEVYMNHHFESSQAHTNVRSVMATSDANFDGDGSHAECERLLTKYVCQIQFPRCYDDPAYVDEDKPIHLHVCYSLCHEVREACGLEHRIDCRLHHPHLNHQYVSPTEHELKYDPRYQNKDPFAEFWRVDCIESPPSTWKYIFHYLVYGGPGSIAAYTIAALIMYSLIAKIMGLHADSPTATVAKLRQSRAAKRIAFEVKMRKQQKKYIKLQEIKTVMIDQQQQEQDAITSGQQPQQAGKQTGSPSLTSQQLQQLQVSVREREQKLAQLDALIAEMESEIQLAFLHMQQVLDDERRENDELGFGGPEGERLMAQAEAELDGDTNEDDAGVKYFGQRRRRVPEAEDAPDDDEEEDVEEEEEDFERKSIPQQRKR
jgi:hypothetical protein